MTQSAARPPATRIVAISTKMYFSHARALSWCRQVADIARRSELEIGSAIELIVFPGFLALAEAASIFLGTGIRYGAQDLFWEDIGPFTGAVSGSELREIGCSYVEVGHAERRSVFAETEQVIRLKIAAAARNNLTPLLCVGEPFRCASMQALDFCIEQLDQALDGANHVMTVVVAYEPAWSIGAEVPAAPCHVAAVCTGLRANLARRYPQLRARVIYGGSAGPGTLTALAGSIDGVFLGRFAHSAAGVEAVLAEIPTAPQPLSA